MTRRFYITSTAVKNPKLLRLFFEAKLNAEDYLINNPDENEIYIVEVVKIVRRAKQAKETALDYNDEVEVIEVG